MNEDIYQFLIGLCELCLKRGIYTPGKIVHHKVKLTAENINDINITLNHDNLLLVCQECHSASKGNQCVALKRQGWEPGAL